MAGAVPDEVRQGQAELQREERRLANLIELAAEGQGSRALGEAVLGTERRVDSLRGNLKALRRVRQVAFTVPAESWIRDRVGRIQDFLDRRTEKSALLIWRLLGPATEAVTRVANAKGPPRSMWNMVPPLD